MATVTFTLDHVCGGGEHALVNVQKDGGATRAFVFSATDVTEPLTEEQLHTAALVVLRMHCQGMTRLQIRNALQAGFTVTL